MYRTLLSALVLSVGLTVTSGPAHAEIVYNAAADFSATANPNGVWSYGVSATLAGSFVRFTNNENYQGLDAWNTGSGPYAVAPAVVHNGTASPITPTPFNSFTVQPGQLEFHPGDGVDDQYTLVRFTAPAAATYALDITFSGIDYVGPTTTDVHILVDGVSIFDAEIASFGSGPSFSATRALPAGSTVDFAVGRGTDGTFYYDSTGLDAGISVVPEPETLTLIAVGAGLLLLYRRLLTRRGGT